MTDKDLSAQIAKAIRDAILDGRLIVDERLPSESDLADRFDVSRPTVREALKRLAAQNLIRTRRGATGGAFVRRLSYSEAYNQQITTSTLLLSMNDVDFATACEARFAMERACAPLACARRTDTHLSAIQTEIDRQADPDLTDEDFCASDVALHRALVDSAGNPVLSYQLAGAIEAIEPLMNMITFTARDRARMLALHRAVLDALAARAPGDLDRALCDLEAYGKDLATTVMARRAALPKDAARRAK